jgi:spore maturation protein CgeB
MKFAIFGLTVSSSWGNGHATLWRGLVRALVAAGHEVTFFERDVPYYATTRDLYCLPAGAELVLYADWDTVAPTAIQAVAAADVAMVTSYCPDGPVASELVLENTAGATVFYDLDTPITLAQLGTVEPPAYLPASGLGDFDLVLSYTGGEALRQLQTKLGARRVAPLYGHVDPEQHMPAARHDAFVADLSYLGTYASDRQARLQELFIEPARLRPALRFVLGGAGYPQAFPWTDNIFFVRHLPPSDHPAFFSSSRLTLNVTRRDMAELGHCPSGRLFEAAACGTPVLSDAWDGLAEFFEPGREILIAHDRDDVLAALDRDDRSLATIAAAAHARVLRDHTSARRAQELVAILRGLGVGAPVAGTVASAATGA